MPDSDLLAAGVLMVKCFRPTSYLRVETLYFSLLNDARLETNHRIKNRAKSPLAVAFNAFASMPGRSAVAPEMLGGECRPLMTQKPVQ
jgi:hypothetical protein